jgi:ankyrin repeat protein
MSNTEPYIIANHLQFYYGKYFSDKLKFNKNNPADVCGMCLYIGYIFKRLGFHELEVYVIGNLGWDTTIDIFRAIGASDHVNYLEILSKSETEAEIDKIFYKFNIIPESILFEKTVNYLSDNISSKLITETLKQLPVLPDTNTELMDAAQMCDYTWVKKLIDNGADPNICEGKNTPLSMAWYTFKSSFCPSESERKCVELLINAGSNPLLGNNKSILEESLTPVDPGMFKLLLDKGWDINYFDSEPIILTLIEKNHPKSKETFKGEKAKVQRCLKHALSKSPNLNVFDTHRYLLPINLSYTKELSEKLIEMGAQIELEYENGLYYMTPLMKAAFDDDLEQLKYWQEKGVGLNRRLKYRYTLSDTIPPGCTAIDIARIRNHNNIYNYLKEHGAVTGEVLSVRIIITKYTKEIIDKTELINKLSDQIDTLINRSGYNYYLIRNMNGLKRKIERLLDNDSHFKLTEIEGKENWELFCKELKMLNLETELR